jgi:hypothetical protein
MATTDEMVDEVLAEQEAGPEPEDEEEEEEERPAKKKPVVKGNKAQQIQAKMTKERRAKVAKARKVIDAADEKRFEEDAKKTREERAKVKRITADRQVAEKEKEKASMAAKKSTGKPKAKGVAAKLSDEELGSAIKKILAKDADTSSSGMVKAVRAAGHSAAGKRIRLLHAKLSRAAKKASKK